jgi:hypothetical protein
MALSCGCRAGDQKKLAKMGRGNFCILIIGDFAHSLKILCSIKAGKQLKSGQ